MIRVLTNNAVVGITPQLHADLRIAWKLLEDAGQDAAANRVFEFLLGASAAGDALGAASEYEQVKTAVEAALMNARAALSAVSQNRAAAQPQSTNLMESMQSAIKAIDDPRNALLTNLKNAVYELEAGQSLNERVRRSDN